MYVCKGGVIIYSFEKKGTADQKRESNQEKIDSTFSLIALAQFRQQQETSPHERTRTL
jgi:hypothetical protein